MARLLDTETLRGAALYYASLYLADRPPYDRGWVIKEFYKFRYKDAFDFVRNEMLENLGGAALNDFETRGKREFVPRKEKDFHDLLADWLAIDPDGGHIPGKIGRVQNGQRPIGRGLIEVETPESIMRRKKRGGPMNTPGAVRETHFKEVMLKWPIYAGETEERLADSGVADPLPDGTPGMPVGATNPGISNESAIAGLNAIVNLFDEGTGAATVKGRTGAQPADPDTTATGTLLHSNACTDPFDTGAIDGTGNAQVTASAIADDTSADATGTVGYVRLSATNDGITPIDDHMDGEAGTSGSDYNYNTTSIVAAATVSISSVVITLPET